MHTPLGGPLEAVILFATAVLAGSVNAIAGGGTLLTFPALLWFGSPALVANATNTLALTLGTSGSLFSFRRHFRAIVPWLGPLIPVSALGGWLGSVLLTRTSEAAFSRLVPFLILFATLVFLAQGLFRRVAGFPEAEAPHPHRRMLGIAMLLQFVTAVYGGYFGAGIGIMMLASLGFLGFANLHAVNAMKNILAAVINAVAAVWFIASGLIDWPRAGLMTGGAILGYFLAAHYSQRVPQAWVRRAVVLIGLAIAAAQFRRQFIS